MTNVKRMLCWTGLLWSFLVLRAGGETIFVEAETMQPSSSGWAATSNDQTGRASRTRTLWGANGAGDAVAPTTARVNEAGRYRVWARYMQVAACRGAFRLTVSEGEKHVAAKTLDLASLPDVVDWQYTWHAGTPLTIRSDPANPVLLHGRRALYFYVPYGTKVIGGFADGPGELRDPNGRTVHKFGGAPGYFSIPVPPGQEAKRWCFHHGNGHRLLMTVPPYLARNAKELLLPREVVGQDTVH